MTTITHENQLQLYCEDLASEVIDEIVQGNTTDPHDLIHQFCDGSQHVIYHYKAHTICQSCNVSDGEMFLEDIGAPEGGWTYDGMASTIVYGELVARVSRIVGDAKDERYLELIGESNYV
tara:strand:- start:457 stop:816 length:360 start_codon:yes stop_codon:yes gene_type:complete